MPDGDTSFTDIRCHQFEAEGDVTFGADVVAVGEVQVTGPRHITDGEVPGD